MTAMIWDEVHRLRAALHSLDSDLQERQSPSDEWPRVIEAMRALEDVIAEAWPPKPVEDDDEDEDIDESVPAICIQPFAFTMNEWTGTADELQQWYARQVERQRDRQRERQQAIEGRKAPWAHIIDGQSGDAALRDMREAIRGETASEAAVRRYAPLGANPTDPAEYARKVRELDQSVLDQIAKTIFDIKSMLPSRLAEIFDEKSMLPSRLAHPELSIGEIIERVEGCQGEVKDQSS